MIFLVFLLGLQAHASGIPSLQTCTHESNFDGRFANSTRIVGGITAGENQWPYLVRLIIENKNGQQMLCGGTVIDNKWVLSAAHCCEGARWIDATFGDRVITTQDSSEYTLRSYNFFNHPKYRKSSYGAPRFDVCLIEFSEDIIALDPEKNVQMACLTNTVPKHASNCWIAGWGTTSAGGSISDPLLQANVHIMDKSYCRAKTNYPYYSLTKEMICAGKLDSNVDGLTDGGVDSCQGNSGGPLICDIDGHAALVGVVSWGYGCAFEGFPGIYSSTAHRSTKNWIRKTVDPASGSGNIFQQIISWFSQLF